MINFNVLKFLWIDTVRDSLTIYLKNNLIEMHMQHPIYCRAIAWFLEERHQDVLATTKCPKNLESH